MHSVCLGPPRGNVQEGMGCARDVLGKIAVILQITQIALYSALHPGSLESALQAHVDFSALAGTADQVLQLCGYSSLPPTRVQQCQTGWC